MSRKHISRSEFTALHANFFIHKRQNKYQNIRVAVLPLSAPGVRNAANNRAEHESSDEGEKDQVYDALQSIVAQSGHGLDVVLQMVINIFQR